MKRWTRLFLALTAVMLLATPSAFAQGGGASSTGSISGEVKDDQGGVLPGVTVTATSPALVGGTATAVTNEAGIYRFPAVPPGEYNAGLRAGRVQPRSPAVPSASAWASTPTSTSPSASRRCRRR